LKTLYLFISYVLTVIFAALICLYAANVRSTIDVLPAILKKNANKVIKRSPIDFSIPVEKRSFRKLSFESGKSFLFEYQKSTKEDNPSAEISFNLNEKEFDFSNYDEVEIIIKTNLARRIAFKLGTHNKKKTNHFVQSFIEIKDKKELYSLPLKNFLTPTSWYHENDVTKDELPEYNSAHLRTISFEACQILAPGINDKFSVYSIKFIKDQKTLYIIISILTFILIIGGWLLVYKPFKKEAKIVFVPIDEKPTEKSQSLEAQILIYLANNFSNSDLTLNDLGAKFGKANAKLSRLLTDETQLSFPKYLSHLRIEAAKKTLRAKSYATISEVGYAVGFNSPSNFIRVFKAQVGVSPKKYAAEQIQLSNQIPILKAL
jgi:AraC-like DNA-binding protein